jgi:hypothetical protein
MILETVPALPTERGSGHQVINRALRDYAGTLTSGPDVIAVQGAAEITGDQQVAAGGRAGGHNTCLARCGGSRRRCRAAHRAGLDAGNRRRRPGLIRFAAEVTDEGAVSSGYRPASSLGGRSPKCRSVDLLSLRDGVSDAEAHGSLHLPSSEALTVRRECAVTDEFAAAEEASEAGPLLSSIDVAVPCFVDEAPGRIAQYLVEASDGRGRAFPEADAGHTVASEHDRWSGGFGRRGGRG